MKYKPTLMLAIPGLALALLLAACGGGGSGSGDNGSATTPDPDRQQDEIQTNPDPDNGDNGSGVTPDPNGQRDEMQITPDPGSGVASWRGLVVAPENRCAPYERNRDYSYPQSVEQDIVHSLGGVVYGPYTARCFSSTSETDIEHIVATSEAHDSGLCAADRAKKRAFARDLNNLTLAAPGVNRSKSGRDAGEWMPNRNRCWFAARVVAVKQRYGLTVDIREAAALERVLSSCASVQMESPSACSTSPATAPPETDIPWDDNGDGRVTCAEARRHGIAPVHRDHPAYQYMRDGDGDGIVCE